MEAGEELSDDAERIMLSSAAARYATDRLRASLWLEELYQEAWIVAWEAWATWEDGRGANRKTWMFTKAYYRAIDVLRHIQHSSSSSGRKTDRTIPKDLEEQDGEDHGIAYEESEFDRIEIEIAVQQILLLASDQHRDLLQKVDIEGMRLADYAKQEGVTEGAISYRRKTAIRSIRMALGLDPDLPFGNLNQKFD